MTGHIPKETSGNDRRAIDIAALGDGRFLAALVVLIANDHWLKAEFGNWLTGKASDVAGLVMLPVIVVCALRLMRFRSATRPVLAVIGLWFTAMKVWPTAAEATERLAETLTGVNNQIIVDPTDLVGLIGLVIAARIIAAPRPLISARAVRLGLLTLGFMATVATSQVENAPLNDLIVDEASGEVSAAVPLDSTYCRPESASDDFDAEAWLATTDGPIPFDACEPTLSGKLGFGSFELESCPELADLVCVRADGAAIKTSKDGSTFETEWSLDPSSPTTFDVLPDAYGYYYDYDPAVKDLIVDRWGTTHVTYRSGLYVTRDADGTWSPPFSDYRPIMLIALAAAAAAALSLFAIAFRRTRSERWWIVPPIALLGFITYVYGQNTQVPLFPVRQLVAVGLFGVAGFFCAVISGRYRKQMPSLTTTVALIAASAALVVVPFLIWKYGVNVSFPLTWLWLPVAVICGLGIDAIIGRQLADRPVPPAPTSGIDPIAEDVPRPA